MKARSENVEHELARIHVECGHAVSTQVYVPQWNRGMAHCAGCNLRGLTREHADAPCRRCNGHMEV